MNRSSFKRWSFSRSASTNLENSNSAVPCGSSSMARNVFPTTLLGMVEVPFCLAYFHTAPGKYNVGSSTRPTPRARPGHSGMAFGRSEDRIVDRHDVLERDLEK